MTESLTFATYSPLEHGAEGIYSIGVSSEGQSGVVQEMAVVFEHDLATVPNIDNLGELIGKVGPAKELQKNIGRVQEILGTDQDAVEIARNWVERSGLLVPVERKFAIDDSVNRPVQYGLAVITGGVRNWISRRADKAVNEIPSWNVLLVAGNREMNTAEGPDVLEGMTEADYIREVVVPRFAGQAFTIRLVEVESGVGNEVMGVGAASIAETADLTNEDVRIAVVSNAGAWVQNAGQMRRALREIEPTFDGEGKQLSVISDGFPLGTGAEPTSTHQNPYTALGQIVRNMQELVRHI